MQYVGDDLRFAASRFVGELPNCCFQIGKQQIKGHLMLVVKVPQFVHDRVRLLEARMPHRLVSSHTGQEQPAESLGNLDADGPHINAPRSINIRLPPVVITMARQVVRDPHQHTPQAAIGLADERAAIAVRLVALMS